MGQDTAIEWADHTFNGWIGCTKVSPACDHCYAEQWGKRFGVAWGAGEPRRRTSAANWKEPLRWNRKAAAEGRRYRVFANSLSDVLDVEVPEAWFSDLLTLVEMTPHLDWLLLTKRHAVAQRRLPAKPLLNARIGMTIENEDMARLRLPRLARLALSGWKTFVSYEPAVGPIDWWPWLDPEGLFGGCFQWIIAGGESGAHARPAHPDWFRATRDACRRAGVPFLMKQWGEWAPAVHENGVLYQTEKVGAFNSWHAPVFDPDRDEGINWRRLGKRRAGRLLDGVEHNGVPNA